RSYASCVERLQEIGYRSIGLGGMVALKRAELLACLEAVAAVRRSRTQFHLFGETPCEPGPEFLRYGGTRFASTSPLSHGFMDDDDNYHAQGRTYSAVRVPQVAGNARLKKRILSGAVDQGEALRLERGCLRALVAYDRGETPLEPLLALLREYEVLHDGRTD